MNRQDKIRCLSSLLRLEGYIDTLIEEKTVWYERAQKISAVMSDMPKAKRKTDRTANALENVIMLEHEIDKNTERLVERRREIMLSIAEIDDITLERIIYMKYVNGMSFETIGEKLGYCTKQISRLHKKAVEKIAI